MTRETKAGLLMIMMLCGVFGFMVYKRMHQPSAAMAQQNPPANESTAEQPEGSEPAEATPAPSDSHVAGAGEFAESNTIIRAAATAAAPMPADTELTRDGAAASERDPFGQPVASPPAKPRLPTSVPDDDRRPTRAPARIAQVSGPVGTTSAQPSIVPNASAASQSDDFDPFNERSATNSSKAPVRSGSPAAPAALEDADPFPGTDITTSTKTRPATAGFDLPANEERKAPTEFSEANDPFPSSAKRLPHGFEAPVVVKPSASNDFTDNPRREASAHPFAANDNLEVQRPANSKTARAAESDATDPGFEIQKSVPTTVPVRVPTAVPELSLDDAFDQPPAKSAVPALTIPSRDSFPIDSRPAAQTDDRLGGFRPAAPSDSTANAFPADERPSAPGFPGDSIPRRAARPAPATQIDEDFGAKSSARPLVAGDTYQIEPSDNYWMISRKKYGTGRYFMALAQHNAQVITDPKRMRPGVIIATPPADALERAYPQLIPTAGAVDPIQTASVSTPGAATSGQATAATSARAAQTEDESDAGFFVANDGTPMYRVGREDTLSGISQRHLGRSSRWVQVFEMNRDVLTDGNTLKIGAVLRLPADASRVDVVGGGRTLR